MSIQETYYQQQNKFLFSNSKLFGNLRKNLLKKFELSSKDNKNEDEADSKSELSNSVITAIDEEE